MDESTRKIGSSDILKEVRNRRDEELWGEVVKEVIRKLPEDTSPYYLIQKSAEVADGLIGKKKSFFGY